MKNPFKELVSQDKAALEKALAEQRAKVADLQLKAKLNQVKNFQEIRSAKKRYAQLLTAISQLTK